MCRLYFDAVANVGQSEIEDASLVKDSVLASRKFKARMFFDKVESGQAVAEFEAGKVTFEECDPLGKLYANLYPTLDLLRKLQCFRRLCRTAVQFHRFSVMGDVRRAYGAETKKKVKRELLRVLAEEDTGKVIHGIRQ